MPNGPDATPQAALMELLECQRVLEEIKEELDLVSDGLGESPDNLTRLRAVTNSARGLHSIVRTFPGCKRRAA